MKTHINPEMITWAREQAGMTRDALAERLKRDPSEVERWESGKEDPSYPMLEKLAYNLLHVPLAIFFFPSPPNIETPKKEFRRLPQYELERFSPDTYDKFRLAQAYQDSLSDLLQEYRLEKHILKDISPSGFSPIELAARVRDYLGVTIDDQRNIRSCESAFKHWRHAIEEVGIYTFKDSFEDRFISGFCLVHQTYPLIFVNNSNSFARQVFTTIHEVGHILYGVNGVTDFDETYIEFMSALDRDLEVRCNAFAAHFLVPDDAFQEDLRAFKVEGVEVIGDIADRYSVSREVILRRLLDHGAVTAEYYRAMADDWNKEYKRRTGKTTGGNFYLTRLAYLGEGYTRLAFENYNGGRLTRSELATHLNMNAKFLPKLEAYVRL